MIMGIRSRMFGQCLYVALLFCMAIGLAGADSVREGGKVLQEGDSVARVYEVLGEPDRRVQLETEQGGAAGQRLEYYRDGDAILVRTGGGRVVLIRRVEQ